MIVKSLLWDDPCFLSPNTVHLCTTYLLSGEMRVIPHSDELSFKLSFGRVKRTSLSPLCPETLNIAGSGIRTRHKKGPAIRIGAEYGTLSQNGYGDYCTFVYNEFLPGSGRRVKSRADSQLGSQVVGPGRVGMV